MDAILYYLLALWLQHSPRRFSATNIAAAPCLVCGMLRISHRTGFDGPCSNLPRLYCLMETFPSPNKGQTTP